MISNLTLIVLNLGSFAVALLVGEYEAAKLRTPEASWIATPVTFDWIMVGLISLVAVVNLAVLGLVVLRHLDHHRRWLWWTTGLGVALVIVLAAVLGARFLPILWPTS